MRSSRRGASGWQPSATAWPRPTRRAGEPAARSTPRPREAQSRAEARLHELSEPVPALDETRRAQPGSRQRRKRASRPSWRPARRAARAAGKGADRRQAQALARQARPRRPAGPVDSGCTSSPAGRPRSKRRCASAWARCRWRGSTRCAPSPPTRRRRGWRSTRRPRPRARARIGRLPRLADLLRLDDAGAAGAARATGCEGVYTAESIDAALAARAPADARRSHHDARRPCGERVRRAASMRPIPSRPACWRARRRSRTSQRQLRAQALIAERREARAGPRRGRLHATPRSASPARAARPTEAQSARAPAAGRTAAPDAARRARRARAAAQLEGELPELDAQLEALEERARAAARRASRSSTRELAEIAGAPCRARRGGDRRRAPRSPTRASSCARSSARRRRRSSRRARWRRASGELQRSIETAAQQVAANEQSAAQLNDELAQLTDAHGAGRPAGRRWRSRLEREQALGARAQRATTTLSAQLRRADEQRLPFEHSLQPLRERITELQLEEQAAQLGGAQYLEQLTQAQVDREALAQSDRARRRQARRACRARSTACTARSTRSARSTSPRSRSSTTGARAQDLPRRAERPTSTRPSARSRTRSARSTSRRATLLRRHLRPGQRALRPHVPGAVRRRQGEARDDRRRDPRRRRAGDGAAAGQEELDHPPAVGRREGADRDRAGVRDLPAQPGAVLPARRGRRAARRRQHRALLQAGARDVGKARSSCSSATTRSRWKWPSS